MNKKKIGLIILLIAIIAIIAVVIVSANKKQDTNKVIANAEPGENRSVEENSNNDTNQKEVTKSTLSDGTIYKTTNEDVKADIVIGDNYFDTQIADINLNFKEYEGKTIEIEGMYLENPPYTFIGRYSTSNLCPDCPEGYTYFEYELNGNDLPKLTDEKDWLKIVGTLKSAYDESISSDYYYIDVLSLEVMNERGIDTVSN